MLGDMISRILKEKNISKTELAKRTGINIGHIIHIEKEERNPSHRALKSICRALEIPYQPLMYTYDKVFTKEQKDYNMPKHISYNKVLAVDSVNSFIECPIDFPNASIAVKITSKDMQPLLEENSYAFIEFNTPLDNNDIGLFEYNGEILIRRYFIRNKYIILRADNKKIKDISISENDQYNIIGKVVGTNTGLIL